MGTTIKKRFYSLNKKQCVALRFYINRYNLKIGLCNLPLIHFIRSDKTEFDIHIKDIESEYLNYEG